MNQQEKLSVLKAWMVTLEYYGRPTNNREVLDAYVSDLEDLPYPRVIQAFVTYRRDPKNRFAPLPAAIRDLVKPVGVSDQAIAIEAVARIVEAIGTIGPYRHEDARRFIGSLGWEVVKRQGGWQEICSVVGDDNPVGVFQAQAIKIALAVMEHGRAGTLGQAPETPGPRIESHNEPKMISMQELLGQIAEKK